MAAASEPSLIGVRIAVLGGGNGSHAAVTEAALRGAEVRWWRRDPASFAGGGLIHYEGEFGEGEVRPALCTEALDVALDGADLVLAPIPATSQLALVPRLAEVLAPGQAVAFTPGTFVSWMGARVRPDVVWLETGTLPYLCRLVGPGRISIPVRATRLPVGSYPGSGPAADAAHRQFARMYPAAVRLVDGLDGALSNWGPVMHPPLVMQNLGAIESLGDRFDIHAEGTSTSVRHTILALDSERIALRHRLGLPGEHWPIADHYERSSRSMYPPDTAERLVASNLWRETLDLDHRYVQEDLLLGLVFNVSLARLAGQPMPVGEALLTLTAVALGVDPFEVGRSAGSLGIGSLLQLRPR